MDVMREAVKGINKSSKGPSKNKGSRAAIKAAPSSALVRSEYKVAAPAAFGSAGVVPVPKINGGGFKVAHCEYLQGINLNTVFTPIVYNLNPGLIDSFPWLGQIGQLFEEYKFNRLRFIFRTRAASSSTGQVMMATQFDSNDPAFTSIEEMMGYSGATYGALWLDQGQDCLRNNTRYMNRNFTRSAPLASGQDPQIYDVGNFSIVAFASSVPAVPYIGDLFVEYEVTLYKPKVLPVTALSYASRQISWGASSVTTNYFLPSAALVNSEFAPSSEAIVPTSSSNAGTYTIPQPGVYIFDAQFTMATPPTADVLGLPVFTSGVSVLSFVKQFSETTGKLIGYLGLLASTVAGASATITKLTTDIAACYVNFVTVTNQISAAAFPGPLLLVPKGAKEKTMRLFPRGSATWRLLEQVREVDDESIDLASHFKIKREGKQESKSGWVHLE